MMRIAVILAFVAIAAAANRDLLSDDTYNKCQKAYNDAGGDNGLVSRAPACAPSDPSKFNFGQCCQEVKSGLSSGGFSGCLCDKSVFDWVEGRIGNAGVRGLNKDTFAMFLRACNIPNVSTGGC